MDLRALRVSRGSLDQEVKQERQGIQEKMVLWEILDILDQGETLGDVAPGGTKEDQDSAIQDQEDLLEKEGNQAEEDPEGAEVNVGPKVKLEIKDHQERQGNQDSLESQDREDPGETREQMAVQDQQAILDSLSESVGLTNFTLEKYFVINTINRLGSMASDPTSSTGTRVGVVQYSHNGTFEAIRLDDANINSMSTFKAAVKNLQWIAGGTFTPTALKFAYDNLIRDSKRARAQVSVIVVTDGRFDPRDDDTRLRYLCDDPKVVVNAIGVGDMFDKRHDSETLASIACNDKNRITEMKRYTDLVAENFIEKMESVLCPDPVIKCPDLPCKAEEYVAPCVGRPVDLVFLLDGSERLGMDNFQHVQEFVQKVADRLAMAKSKNDQMRSRLALIEFGKENENRVAFNLTHNREVVAAGITALPYLDSSSVVGAAITYSIDHILGKGRGRKTRRGAEISFVFITDGITDTRSLDEAVSAMRREQIISTVIATGSDIDNDVLKRLAMNDQEAIFKGEKLSDMLQPSLFERFIQWVC